MVENIAPQNETNPSIAPIETKKEYKRQFHTKKLLMLAGFLILFLLAWYRLPILSQNRQIAQNIPAEQAKVEIPVQSTLGLVYLHSGDTLYVLDESTNTIEKLIDEYPIYSPQIDPTDNTLYYLYNGQIWNYDFDTKETKVIPIQGKINGFSISPFSDFVSYNILTGYTGCCGNTEATMPLTDHYISRKDGSNAYLVNYPPKLPEDSNSYVYEKAMLESWVPDGKRAILRGHGLLDTTNNFWELDLEKNEVEKFTTFADYNINLMPSYSFSPKGDQMAYYRMDQSNSAGVWLVNIDGTNKNVLVPDGDTNNVTWSPSGKLIALEFDPSEANVNESFLVLNTSGEILYRVDLERGEYMSGIWSHDERFIAAARTPPYDTFTREYPTGHLVIIDLAEGSETEVRLPEEEEKEYVKVNLLQVPRSNRVYYKKVWENENGWDIKEELWYFDLASEENVLVQEMEPYTTIL